MKKSILLFLFTISVFSISAQTAFNYADNAGHVLNIIVYNNGLIVQQNSITTYFSLDHQTEDGVYFINDNAEIYMSNDMQDLVLKTFNTKETIYLHLTPDKTQPNIPLVIEALL